MKQMALFDYAMKGQQSHSNRESSQVRNACLHDLMCLLIDGRSE
jgi:hypothetical protein